YPFILMDQIDGNGLPDPYGWSEQPALPWRGRITCDLAPGQAGSPDGTEAVDADVAAFFGTSAPSDFEVLAGEVHYRGPEEWTFRRMILHYAHLCVVAGGVESFCIGSEMRGLTTLRGAHGFPAVQALKVLAADVRKIMGPDVKIGYAADWSEYFGYHPADGSGDLFFHLDALWSDQNVDFVGIDNYMPLSDWRGEAGEADAVHQGPHNLDYLKKNIEGGEGFDWYYASDADRAAQLRQPISDGGYSEPWVWRYKDIRGWWSAAHHNRIAGVRQDEATSWLPGSKPIRFTELGCAAIDKGTNQPNKFLDPKSSESALPLFSDGGRDDFLQVQYLRAMDEYWGDPALNPVSSLYDGPMVDMAHAYVWAWDARPFPAFPGLPGVWSDAGNYYRGHWLTGRSGYRTLASVVAEICHRSGVRAIDVTRLRGVVRGYAITEVTDTRAALQPLMLAYGFESVEREGVLRFSMRRTDGSVMLNEAELLAADGGDLVAVRDPEAEEAGRVSVGYVAETGDFPTGTAEAIAPGRNDTNLARVELPLVLTSSEARGTAERWLAEAQAGRDRISFALPPSRFGLGAGDLVSIRGALWRLDRVEQGDVLQVEAVRVPAGRSLAAAGGVLEDAMEVTPAVLPTPPVAVFMDLPVLDADGIAAPRIAVGSARWAGPVAVLSSVEDAGYKLETRVPMGAVLGLTETVLDHAATGLVDRGAPLQVRLLNGALASVSDAALLSGANAMAIGSGEDDRWEVFQFRDAKLIGPRTWSLSHRLRGQVGTDAVMPSAWRAGSRVVLLDAAVETLKPRAAQRDLVRHWRVGPANQPLDGPSFIHAIRGFAGVGLRPYSPAHLRLAPAGNDLRATWVRRTRIDGDSWSGRDVPLGEEVESYQVRVMRDGEVIREVEVGACTWAYAAAERVADGRGCRLEVAQLARAFGPGPAVALALPDP
ncbi:glycoside hydrolase/phage tail family protein, partial [Palleronia sp.]|uniref:baseplate multidomain protein megatron n=1 Tax=Palleronia sp. TaxID=1940284 RepID=UPI0035C865C5